MCRVWLTIIALLSLTSIVSAQGKVDSCRFIQRLELEVRPAYIIPTNGFLRGENEKFTPIQRALSGHFKYSFQHAQGSLVDRIYSGSYQGLGLGYYSFGYTEKIGDPLAFYLFQGARLARFNPRLSLNYEWNFGISFGWKPYDYDDNSFNKMIGSKINAYINANFYLKWMLTKELDLTAGITLTHFSNGNTEIPNAGLNTGGLKVGLVYNLNRNNCLIRPLYQNPVPRFPRYISYDLTVFGSWRRKGLLYGDSEVASPEAYTVVGFSFAPMYNFGYKLRAGVAVDGVYDGSANIYTNDFNTFYRPSLDKQLAIGLSGRVEYVMPYFTVGIGLGANILHKGGDLKSFYQILALKIEVTRSSYIHIGYNLQNFHTPNYLMLGIGYRFNNKYPTFHR